MFGLICHQLYLYDNSLFEVNHSVSTARTYDWMLYALDNFIRSVMLDFLETFSVKISRIDSNNIWILSLVFFFKSTLSIFFIKSIFNLSKSMKKVENKVQ